MMKRGKALIGKQFAALAEALEARFYEQALQRFGGQDYVAAGLDGGVRDQVE